MSNIFDTKDLADIPDALLKELNLTSDADKLILSLFEEAKSPLGLTALLVAYYRKHKFVRTRQYMMTACYRMKKKGLLTPTKNKGEYKITPKAKDYNGRPAMTDNKALGKTYLVDLPNEDEMSEQEAVDNGLIDERRWGGD